MHRAALVASLTAVSIRMASSGSTSRAWGTRSTPLVPGMRMSHSISATLWRWSCCSASSPDPAVYTSNCCWARNFFRALRMGSSSSTTSTETGPEVSTTRYSLPTCRENGAPQRVWIVPARRPGGRRSAGLPRRQKDEIPWRRHQASAVRPREQLGDRLPAGNTIVDGVGVDIHADESVGLRRVEAAAEALGMLQRFWPVGEAVDDARLQIAGDGWQQLRAEIAAHHVAPERQGQPRLAAPPFSHVRPQMQPALSERELTLVDQHAGVGAAGRDVVLDLIERHNHGPHLRLVELQGKPGSRERAGN